MLNEYALKVGQELRTIHGIGNVVSNSSVLRPELVVRPDFARAADLGVTSSQIAETLRVATNGDYDQSLAKLNLPDRQLPIVVKLRDDARQDIQLLSHLVVQGSRGPVMIGNVATLSLESGPAEIDRYDRQRNISFEIELAGQPLGKVQAAVLALPSIKNMPAGVEMAPVGDAEMMRELFSSFGLAMFTGVMCIYIVLVLLFRDFMQPATILCALILSIPGAFLALFLTHTAISMPSMIGIIMLMGIATKNSILLVEYAIVSRRERGMNRSEALLDACKKRARPIVMTTMAMGAGMMPVALDLGVGRWQLPLADGDRGDRRSDHVDLPQPAGDSGGIHLCGRSDRMDARQGQKIQPGTGLYRFPETYLRVEHTMKYSKLIVKYIAGAGHSVPGTR